MLGSLAGFTGSRSVRGVNRGKFTGFYRIPAPIAPIWKVRGASAGVAERRRVHLARSRWRGMQKTRRFSGHAARSRAVGGSRRGRSSTAERL